MRQKDLIKMIEKDGWYVFRSGDNIQQFRHTLKMGIITIYGNSHDAVANYSINSIIDKAGLR
ncbi:MAG: type II toxin-antitoxin system HicA family toxin [Ignavibacteriales bacterium]